MDIAIALALNMDLDPIFVNQNGAVWSTFCVTDVWRTSYMIDNRRREKTPELGRVIVMLVLAHSFADTFVDFTPRTWKRNAIISL